MPKNSKLHFAIETEIFESLKKEAEQQGLSLSALCRQKLRECSKLNRIEFLVEDIQKKLNNKINNGR
jgi:hypothetical protein